MQTLLKYSYCSVLVFAVWTYNWRCHSETFCQLGQRLLRCIEMSWLQEQRRE